MKEGPQCLPLASMCAQCTKTDTHTHTESRSSTEHMTSKGLGVTVAMEGGPHANRRHSRYLTLSRYTWQAGSR